MAQQGGYLLLCTVTATAGGALALAASARASEGGLPSSPHSAQSGPNSSAGCWVRSEPLPQTILSAAQYRSQPQQLRSGRGGLMGNFLRAMGLRDGVAAPYPSWSKSAV